MAFLTHALALLGLVVLLVAAVDLPSLPLHSSSRWILDANDQRVKLKCVNWAGHMEVNIPEGLHKQPVDFLAEWVANSGFNCVRLTYAIDMALHPNISIADSFRNAAEPAGVSSESLSNVHAQAVEKNPWLATATTLEAHGAVIDALARHGVMTVLDNHVSKSSWCCNLDDGNGWWNTGEGYNDANSRFFITDEWLAGLTAMAAWAKNRPGVVGMGVRNEIREFLAQGFINGRQDWYDLVGEAARLIHQEFPDGLILIGGTMSSTDLTHVRSRGLDFSAWRNKHVWEWHAYSFTVTFTPIIRNCWFVQQLYGAFNGFLLEQNQAYTAPLILSEFGFDMQTPDTFYLDCLRDYATSNDGDWAIWALQGSYYVRDQEVDRDEPYGVMNREWTDFRAGNLRDLLGRMWETTQRP